MGNKISKSNIFLTYPTSVIACLVAIFCAYLTSVNCFNVETSFSPFISLIITYSVTGGNFFFLIFLKKKPESQCSSYNNSLR